MTDYRDGKIHGWNGGECPVHPKDEVDVWLTDGLHEGMTASEWDWKEETDPVAAFRVTKAYREPREVWINEYPHQGLRDRHYETKDAAESNGLAGARPILFREVLE